MVVISVLGIVVYGQGSPLGLVRLMRSIRMVGPLRERSQLERESRGAHPHHAQGHSAGARREEACNRCGRLGGKVFEST